MRRLLHLMPYDGIGGVEEAARSMEGLADPDFAFERRFLFPQVSAATQRRATHNPARILAEGLRIARQGPEVLVVSLWRAAIAGVVARLLNRRIRLVLFIHNAADAHGLDRLCTRIALRLADAVWTDSAASVETRFKRAPRAPVTVISFLVHRLDPLPESPPAPRFVFWGRLTAQKDLSRALRLFAAIHAARPDARFRIIGPDGGEEADLKAFVQEEGLSEAVSFAGPLPFADIPEAAKGASFYLQTSRYEGMALSVTEAMQLGLVPVVTPVGEIARYAGPQNAVIVEEDGEAAQAVLTLIADPPAYAARRAAAIAAWADKAPYGASVFAAARALPGLSGQGGTDGAGSAPER